MPGQVDLEIEQQLAHAHKALWRAAGLAEHKGEQGLTDDLYNLCLEVGPINLSLLTERKYRRTQGRGSA